jgi:hypothetical protein
MDQTPMLGSIDILSAGNNRIVSFPLYARGSGGSLRTHKCEGDDGLIAFLHELNISQKLIDKAPRDLHQHGSASIDNVPLSTEQLRHYGL